MPASARHIRSDSLLRKTAREPNNTLRRMQRYVTLDHSVIWSWREHPNAERPLPSLLCVQKLTQHPQTQHSRLHAVDLCRIRAS